MHIEFKGDFDIKIKGIRNEWMQVWINLIINSIINSIKNLTLIIHDTEIFLFCYRHRYRRR